MDPSSKSESVTSCDLMLALDQDIANSYEEIAPQYRVENFSKDIDNEFPMN
jgi:hypothetical protein